MFMTQKSFFIALIISISAIYSYSQDFNFENPSSPYSNPITTAVPSLLISPDSRGSGMGELGVATSSDINSQHHNAAKYVFNKSMFGISMSYSPWLKELVGDIDLAYVAGFVKLTEMDAIAMSLRYFSMGAIQFTDYFGQPIGGERSPHEYAIDLSYSRKFTDAFSMAITPRFIYSNLASNVEVGGLDMKPGMAGAADVAFFYEQDFKSLNYANQTVRAGLVVSNIGNKISYTNGSINKDFLPTNLRIGVSYTVDFDKYNKLTFSGELSKLLVPTKPIIMTDELGRPIMNGEEYTYFGNGINPQRISVVQGMIRSFYDAPGGFNEEMREIIWSFGAEYYYNDLFALRAGAFFENKYKGSRKFAEIGIGLKYNVFNIDVSYLISFTKSNPLENTLRFSLGFNFDSFYASEIKKQGIK